MKKSFVAYMVGWLAALALFNLIVFLIPGEDKYTAMFWLSYVLITVAFIGQLACTYYAFRGDSLQKTFYNISFYSLGISSLTTMLVVGSLCMVIPGLPAWLGALICAGVVVFYVVAAAKTVVAVEFVSEVDKKVKVKTVFIKLLTADAETLAAKAAGTELESTVRKVYEAIRYSDPMSDDALADVETRISQGFADLSEAVDKGENAQAEDQARRLLLMIAERNNKCRVLK